MAMTLLETLKIMKAVQFLKTFASEEIHNCTQNGHIFHGI